MCGIAGIVSLTGRPVFKAEVHAMCDAMTHRGPDDAGYFTARDVGLGMRRLSIIDLDGGSQPVYNEDRTICVVLNGEIYNFLALRRELEARGHLFRTDTDTEVIVHLYEDVGVRCVERLRGMFTFAVWDGRRRQAFIARDRLGIKPLYYTEVNGRLLFASEVKPLLQVPDVERRLNPDAVSHTLAFLTSPAKDSVIAGVRKLLPGHWMIAARGYPIRTERYWDVAFEPDYSHDEGWFVERLQDLLDQSVKLHMVSDVPLGAFLSGGLDSSAVVATMTRHSARTLKTFSIGFVEPEFDEGAHAKRVAGQFATDHHELIVDRVGLDVIEDVVWHMDEPFGDPSAIPTYLVSQLAAEHVTVVLSGDGGDELFAGYDKYLVERRERVLGALPAPIRRALGFAGQLMPDGMRGRNFVRHFALDGWARYLDAATFFSRVEQERLLQPAMRAQLSRTDPWQQEASRMVRDRGHWLTALQRQDLQMYLPLDILTKVDRMSMAHSIEARVPLLDHKLVEFAATIPPELQLKNGRTKHIFKRAMAGTLADDLINRRKHGFAVPLNKWFRGSLADYAHDLLLSQRSRERGIFSPEYVKALLAQQRGGRPLDFQLWTLLSFEQWCRLVIDPVAAPDLAEGQPGQEIATAGSIAGVVARPQ